MYTEQEYLYGWLAYALGAALLFGCGWLLLALVRWKWLRILLRAVLAAALATPWYADDELTYLAPAWVIAAFEGFFEGGAAFWRAGRPLLAAMAVTAAATAMMLAILWTLRRRRAPSQPVPRPL